MVWVPALVWRRGTLARAVMVGLAVGVPLGLLAWLDSGMWLSATIVTVVMALFFGIGMPRRMNRYWPGAANLSPDERFAAVDAVRRGERVADPALAPAVLDYSRGLHTAAEKGWPFRWLIWLVLIVSAGSAIWDSVFGSIGNAIASIIYLVLFLLEVFWVPKRQDRLLAHADRAADIAGEMLDPTASQ
jgi:hypothetical protein